MILWDITMWKLHKIPNPIWDQHALYQWYVWISLCIPDASRMENVPLRSADYQICPCWSTLPWTDFRASACHKMADRANHLWCQKTRLGSLQEWKVRILMLWQDSSNTSSFPWVEWSGVSLSPLEEYFYPAEDVWTSHRFAQSCPRFLLRLHCWANDWSATEGPSL